MNRTKATASTFSVRLLQLELDAALEWFQLCRMFFTSERRNDGDTMSDEFPQVVSAEIPSTKQKLFVRYFTAILIDLVVLNLFAEYWQHVAIDSFTISLLAALLLQVLLKLTLALEHWVADYFNQMTGAAARIMRYASAWIILFASKFLILAAINFAFGTAVYFGGPWHGVVAFIVVVVAILGAEEGIVRLFRRLG